jgi:pimeloyl-ACP methyl ester carboxylesterase
LLGEFVMGLTTKTFLKLAGKESRPSGEPWPQEMLDSVWKHFDHGTQRAILKLYRSAPPEVLEQAGERLSLIDAPALVLWGEKDPYIPRKFAEEYAAKLPNGKLNILSDAGHWPWIDRQDSLDVVTDFLLNGNTSN